MRKPGRFAAIVALGAVVAVMLAAAGACAGGGDAQRGEQDGAAEEGLFCARAGPAARSRETSERRSIGPLSA
jgi:hypothetical protein